MSDAKAETLSASEWSGGALPYRVGHKKLGMWLFILSDSLTFAALLMGYSYVRFSSDNWAKPFQFSPSVIFSTVMTMFLLSSSLTMVMAVSAAKHGKKRAARKWIFATMACGLGFVVLHLIEWMHLIGEGLTPFQLPREWIAEAIKGGLPTPSPLFGATFFGITGLHMFHVFSGVCYLGVIAMGIKRFTDEDVEISGLYWHFVDLVWMFVFPLVYLLSVPPRG